MNSHGRRPPSRKNAQSTVRPDVLKPVVFDVLDRIQAPVGVVATAIQAYKTVHLYPPNGLSESIVSTVDRAVKIPAPGSAMHVPCLFYGYMSAHCASFATKSSDVQSLMSSEEAELCDYCEGRVPEDDSLLPRPVGVWLLVMGDSVLSGIGRDFVDAFSHMSASRISRDNASAVVSKTRMTVLAGTDASYAFSRFAKDSVVGGDFSLSTTSVLLVFRWAVANVANPGTWLIRSHLVDVVKECDVSSSRGGTPVEVCASALATTMIKARTMFSLDIPYEIAASRFDVPTDAFVCVVKKVSDDFFNEINAEPVKTLGPYASSPMFSHNFLQECDVFVRLVPRSGDGMDLCRNDAFHCFILCHPDRVADTRGWAKQHEKELPCPDPTFQSDWALHLCGPWTEQNRLNKKVSLYGHKGRWPEPIASPGSWVMRTTPVICPLDDRITRNYHVIPCHRSSTLPSDGNLLSSYKALMAPVFAFYRDMRSKFDAAQQVRQRMLVQNELRGIAGGEVQDTFLEESLSDSSEKLQWQLLSPADADEETEKYLIDAFGIDPSSKRVTVGDAYTTLMKRNAPVVLTNLFLNAIMRIGANGSIRDAFAQATTALAMLNQGAIRSKADDDEINRLKRVAKAALETSSLANKKKKKILPREIEKKMAEQLIVMCGLERQLDVTFVMNESGTLNEEDSNRAVNVLSKIFETDMLPNALRQVVDLFTCPSWTTYDSDEGLKDMLFSASKILRASVETSDDVPGANFMFSRLSEMVRIERFDEHCLTPVAPGDVLNEVNPRVLWTERNEDSHTIVAMCGR